VLTVNASDVTVRDVWVTDAGYSTTDNDAAVWVAGANATVDGVRVTNTTFGVWVDGASGATIRDSAIVGRESIARLSDRGNGIQLWEADGAVVANNTITDARDGIYFSWSTDVLARNNTMWDLRYGVHYMYSDHNRLANNTAFDNDVGYALMVSDDIDVVDNVAVNNSGTSGHGVLLKEVDHSRVARNDLVGNGNGLFVYNSMDNDVVDNLVLANDVGVHLTAGSTDARASGNSFVDNGDAMKAVLGEQVAWNGSDRGNYWDGARPVDVDHDGVSEVRFQATGVLDEMSHRQPEVEVFASSPAFDAVRLATRSVPLLETPGVVDHHPWRDRHTTTGGDTMSEIEISDVEKRYGTVTALDGVSLTVDRGETFGLVGRNGAGKTTLFKMLVGHATPDAGSVSVGGLSPTAGTALRERVGYLPEQAGFPPSFTGREVLGFHARVRDVPGDVRDQRVQRVLQTVGLADAADRHVGGTPTG